MYATVGLKGSVLEKFKAVKEAGFEGVEPMGGMDQDEVVQALEATGLKAASVCCHTHWARPLSDPNPGVREVGLGGLKSSLRDAKKYGAGSVLLVPAVVNKQVSYADGYAQSQSEIRKALPLAQELEVKIAIENVWNNFITKPEQAVRFLDEINSPHVGWHFDIGNCVRFSPPEEWIPALGKHILKLHIKEYSMAKRFSVKLSEGDNNWPAIMKALDAVGYSGTMAMMLCAMCINFFTRRYEPVFNDIAQERAQVVTAGFFSKIHKLADLIYSKANVSEKDISLIRQGIS
jgi:hexulose-6-phosphate isomerase